MRIFLNENKIETGDNISLAELLMQENIKDTSGLAIAVNNQVIAKLTWNDTALTENDKIIIITATAGG